MSKAVALIFDTDFTSEMRDVKVKDGKIVISDKEWVVDKTTPFQHKTAFGMRPLYMLKWNSLIPLEWNVVSEERTFTDDKGNSYVVEARDIKPVDYKEIKWEPSKILPAMLRQTGEMKFLKNMKSGTEKPDITESLVKILPVIIIGAIVVLGVTLLWQSGMIKTIFGIG